MNRAEFESLIAEEFPKAVPEKFRHMVKNVAFLVEDTPSREIRREEHLTTNETLLGLYRGVPRAMRGDYYGVGPTVPDVITLFRVPIHEEAEERVARQQTLLFEEALRLVVHETIWHEVAHYLGMGEHQVRSRERERLHDKPAVTSPEKGNVWEKEEPTGDINDLLPNLHNRSSSSETPTTSMDPIEVDKEDPAMHKKLHEPVMPRARNFSSLDSEGGGNDMKNWWEEKGPADLPEQSVEQRSTPDRSQKKVEPPNNLPI